MSDFRFLLDQMLDTSVEDGLNSEGFHAAKISSFGMARADDEQILAFAIEKGVPLITLDEHFGDWAVLPLKQHCGVIRIKANPATSANVLAVLLPFLRRYATYNFSNTLFIVSERGVRKAYTGCL